MSRSSRVVRVAPSFFRDLDLTLPEQRGPDGEPSAHDFLVTDLPEASQFIGERFDDLPVLVPELPALRMSVQAELVVHRFAVYAIEAADGSINLVGITIDR